jgi:hypothetical protein
MLSVTLRPSGSPGCRRANGDVSGAECGREVRSAGAVPTRIERAGATPSVAEEYVARGYVRLNRDERGGSLRELADALDEELSSGVRRVVLDNTYLTRARGAT